MHTRFTSIINEIHSLGEIIPWNKLVRKILSVLVGSWERKVNVITEAKDMQKLTVDELIWNLKTYDMNKKKDNERREPKKEKKLVLKEDNSDSSENGSSNGGIPKKARSSRNTKGYDCCHKCVKPEHFIKDCPLHKQDNYKHNADKTVKRNPLPDRKLKRRDVVDNVVKQTLDAWGDFSSESKGDDEQGDTSMMAVESEAVEYDSIFAQMAKSYEEENNDDDETVVKGSSQKCLLSISQICDKGNKVVFLSKSCTITNLITGGVVLIAKMYKTIYVVDFDSLNGCDLTCLSAVYDDAQLWHKRLRHASFSLLNKIIKKDLVRGLPKSKLKDHKVCDACVKGKQVRSPFKPKKEVSTSRPLDLLHMDLCGL
uniref:GAG-pre-integrase domain-containing protein n=1 Tax=Nicotiana tabacum TaxID=4097 RepID=A0A1S3ZVN5_TOBAC|nr:PREDICTED: uncharacterized protein LOC107790967 [Nicotiana tabacum]